MAEFNQALDILWSMPVEDRNVAYLHYCESMPVSEIAKTLQMNSEQVSKRLSSARRMMSCYL
ncbi:MAG: sigma-70 family RNA polymerase sigma factor [Clostridia bacterium]|nr:sigma-70 family RNA polymerase sigma factor [Clostridia bacterium]